MTRGSTCTHLTVRKWEERFAAPRDHSRYRRHLNETPFPCQSSGGFSGSVGR
jgi:hypothetical protein